MIWFSLNYIMCLFLSIMLVSGQARILNLVPVDLKKDREEENLFCLEVWIVNRALCVQLQLALTEENCV